VAKKGTTPKQGWGNPDPRSSRSKFHFFKPDGMSLCGKWSNALGLISLEDGSDNHADNCGTCRKKIAAYRAQGAAAAAGSAG
jgi:hypothetical protein